MELFVTIPLMVIIWVITMYFLSTRKYEIWQVINCQLVAIVIVIAGQLIYYSIR